jgi:DNA-binding NarL/FixJ family response regulator
MNVSMLQLNDHDLDAVLKFLKSHLQTEAMAHAGHACVVMLVPLQEAPRTDLNGAVRSAGLTERELNVLKGVADGRSNAQIAWELNTTVGSIKGTVQSLFHKLSVRAKKRSALVTAAIHCDTHAPVHHSQELAAQFTDIEKAVLAAAGQHQNTKEIASRLNIPQIRVKAALRSLCAKAQVRNRNQLVRRFLT